jgi:hypothetical protein
LLFPDASLPLGRKLFLNIQKVSRQGAEKEHKKTYLAIRFYCLDSLNLEKK